MQILAASGKEIPFCGNYKHHCYALPVGCHGQLWAPRHLGTGSLLQILKLLLLRLGDVEAACITITRDTKAGVADGLQVSQDGRHVQSYLTASGKPS